MALPPGVDHVAGILPFLVQERILEGFSPRGNVQGFVEQVKGNGNGNIKACIVFQDILQDDAAQFGAHEFHRNAGHELALQVLAAIRNGGGTFIGPVVTSGGAWKGSRHMFEAFRDEVTAVHPDADVRFPDFEPLVGSVILRMMKEDGSADVSTHMTHLRDTFSAFRYKLPPDYIPGTGA